jgi:hypothetical protein
MGGGRETASCVIGSVGGMAAARVDGVDLAISVRGAKFTTIHVLLRPSTSIHGKIAYIPYV